MIFYASQLKLISAVTDALNALGKTGALDEERDFYVHVELRDQHSHAKVGAWSDEIASDAWYFDDEDRATEKGAKA